MTTNPKHRVAPTPRKKFPEPLDLRKVKVYPLAERQSLSALDQLLVDPGQPPRACDPAALASDS